MDERIGKRGWRIWSGDLPQDAVPLGDAKGVVAQLEAENARLRQQVTNFQKILAASVGVWMKDTDCQHSAAYLSGEHTCECGKELF